MSKLIKEILTNKNARSVEEAEGAAMASTSFDPWGGE